MLQPRASEMTAESYRVPKIAVIDTGLSNEDYQLLMDSQVPLSYTDLVEKGSPPCDLTGHGTSAVALVLRMCPNASIHVARVLKGNTALLRDVEAVVEVRAS